MNPWIVMGSDPWIHGPLKNMQIIMFIYLQNGRPVFSRHFPGISCRFPGISCRNFLQKCKKSWNFRSHPWKLFLGHPCKTIVFPFPWKSYPWKVAMGHLCKTLIWIYHEILITRNIVMGHPCKNYVFSLPWNSYIPMQKHEHGTPLQTLWFYITI